MGKIWLVIKREWCTYVRRPSHQVTQQSNKIYSRYAPISKCADYRSANNQRLTIGRLPINAKHWFCCLVKGSRAYVANTLQGKNGLHAFAITPPKINRFGWFVTAAVRSLLNKADSQRRVGGSREVQACTLSVRFTQPPTERAFCTLHTSQLTNLSLASLWIYSVVTGPPTHTVGGPDYD